ncbi:MAG: hypothetical protein Q4F72_11730, partial [Desulfovibrionaceae bacterium]|nr:hypothetical protein [Desulfovibrionaceae bacterium]
SLAVFMGCGGREGPFRPIWAAMQLFNMLAAAAERGVEYVCAVAARDWPVPCSCGAFWQTVRPEKDVRLALRDTAAPEA